MKRTPAELSRQINQALRSGSYSKALNAAGRLIKLRDASVQDCMNVVQLARDLVDWDLSIAALKQARRKSPEDTQILFALITALYEVGYTKESVKLLGEARAACETASDFEQLGSHWTQLEYFDEAIEAYRRSLELDPNNRKVIFDLGISLGFKGDLDEAEGLYNQAISGGKGTAHILLNRSWLRKQKPDANHIDELSAAVPVYEASQRSPSRVHYALGKEYEDLGQVDQAMIWYNRGADAQRQQNQFSLPSLLEEYKVVQKIFDRSFFEQEHQGANSEEPIFVVSMPRAGSTLVERIIGRHRDVQAAGELTNFMRLLNLRAAREMREANAAGDLPLKYQTLVDFRELGRSYVASTRPLTGEKDHFTDKLPLNHLFCGAIHTSLPNAKIVHVHRHPMDACFAMYKQCFHVGYDFTYDLAELGTVYAAYMGLINHWDEVMPGVITHVAYEDLVSDQEGQTRRLIEKLGLEWDDACLDHTATSQHSATASATQVRQPIHSGSVGKWRSIAEQLAPLRRALEEGGIEVE